MPTTHITLTHKDYTVGWICALAETELAVSQAMLDEKHSDLRQAKDDRNCYVLGRMGEHNVVLACLPSGVIGIGAAAAVSRDLVRSFPSIRFGLMVGIGGGAPSNIPSDDPRQDIHLGDVVVSTPKGNSAAVLQYDFGKRIDYDVFNDRGSLNKPPNELLAGVAKLQAHHRIEGTASVQESIDSMLKSKKAMQQDFQKPKVDQLFKSDYNHVDDDKDCEICDKERLIQRKPRTSNDPVIHYGLIGSANQVMRHGGTREKLRREKGIICFEMEAAGLMDNFPCLVIRGICDYSDTHKNKKWQPYAAATAAAYAKELLGVIPPTQVNDMCTAAEAIATDVQVPVDNTPTAADTHTTDVLPVPTATDSVDKTPTATDTAGVQVPDNKSRYTMRVKGENDPPPVYSR